MDRKEAFSFIKEHNLKDEINKVFKRNFTNVSTKDLIEYIENYNTEKPCNEYSEDVTLSNDYTPACVDKEARKAIKAIAHVLNLKDIVKNI